MNRENGELLGEATSREVPNWQQGTSRDLFHKAGGDAGSEPARDKSFTGLGGDADDRDAAAMEVAEGDRFDGRDAALRDFRLDPVSEASAHRLGEQLAIDVPLAAWQTADLAERVRMCDDMYRILGPEMAPHALAPLPEFDKPAEEMGWSNEGEVFYNIRNLDDPTAQDTIETLAHEYRHAWQEDVIKGDQVHPEGEDGRRALIAGLQSYDVNDVREVGYAANEMEMDAEKFARHVYAQYLRRS